MNTTTRLAELRRDLAALETERGQTRRRFGNGGQVARGREADHPNRNPQPKGGRTSCGGRGVRFLRQICSLSQGASHTPFCSPCSPAWRPWSPWTGLVSDASQIEKHLGALSGVLPAQTLELLSDQLHKLVETSSSALSAGATVGLLLALWSASRGMSGMITALNIAYEEKERRGFFKLNFIALGLTIGLMAGGIVVIALVAVLPAAVQFLDLGAATKWLLLLVQWPLLIVLVMLGLAVLYRYAPDRDKAQWRWVSPGAIAATILWVVASIGFTVYVTNFNSYDKTYGSLGGVIILLTWLYLSVLMVLFGAVINAQSEKQTRKDLTEGPPRAMGQRDAQAADTLGETR